MNDTYTCFCRDKNDLGTTWIDTVEAQDVETARCLASEVCAHDWGEGWEADDIACIGVFAGNVLPLFWEDLSE